MANRLKDATSPYLLQHADNPVDWWPWTDEAFGEARRLLVGRGWSTGGAAAYVCRHSTCRLPVTDPAALRAELDLPRIPVIIISQFRSVPAI